MVTAVPMADAIETLTAAWSSAYRAIGGGRTGAIPTADLLSGRASTIGAGIDEWRKWKAGLSAPPAAGPAAAAAERAKGVFGKAARAFSMRSSSRGASDRGGGDEDTASSVGGAGGEEGRPKKASLFKRMGARHA
jgi:hypothetical protein